MSTRSNYKPFGHGTRRKKEMYSRSHRSECTHTFCYMFPELIDKEDNYLALVDENRKLLEDLGDILGRKADTTETDSQIPAGFTYLGQFIDHDITLDPFSSFETNQPQDPLATINFRTPGLDLDSIYGRGPAIDPYLYDHNTGDPRTDGIKLLLGENRSDGPGGPRQQNGTQGLPVNFELPRTSDKTAIIGDPRNNENLMIAQLHFAFLRFHNAVVDHVIAKFSLTDSSEIFAEAKKIVTHHYQWVVVKDFLQKIVGDPTMKLVFQDNQQFYDCKPSKMPVEFAMAAYRFGHSMVRNSYIINDNFINSPISLNDAFAFVRGDNLPIYSNRVVDFNRFFFTHKKLDVNFAKKIDTHLSLGLTAIPSESPNPIMSILAIRNLLRGWVFRLPTGQVLTKYFGGIALTEDQLLQNATPEEAHILKRHGGRLLRKTPLWYYILKEAELNQGNRLGQLGGRILAETFKCLLNGNPDSYIHVEEGFRPSLPSVNGTTGHDFTMGDLLQFAGVLEP